MQVIDHLVKEVGLHQVALVVDNVDLDPPFTLGEPLNFGRLITVGGENNEKLAFGSYISCLTEFMGYLVGLARPDSILVCALLSSQLSNPTETKLRGIDQREVRCDGG